MSAASAPVATVKPSAINRDEELVPVFNRSPKGGDYIQILFEAIKDDAGRVVSHRRTGEWRAVAGTFSKIPRWLAEEWKRQVPSVIVDAAGVGAPPIMGEKSAEVLALEEKNREADRRIANLEKLVSDLRGSHL